MIHTDDSFSEKVEAEVARIEAQTDAELVVVAASQSGSYADLASLGASVLAFVVLAVLLLIPWQVSPIYALVDVVLVWGVGRWLFDTPWFLRRVASNGRMDEQVRLAAAAEFHIEAVHATPGRHGLLIYVSALEGRVELIADVGLEASIPRGRWAAAAEAFSHDDLDHFITGLGEVGTLLAESVPHTESAHHVDLPNAPRIRT